MASRDLAWRCLKTPFFKGPKCRWLSIWLGVIAMATKVTRAIALALTLAMALTVAIATGCGNAWHCAAWYLFPKVCVVW